MYHSYEFMSSYCVQHTTDFQAAGCPGQNRVIPSSIWRHPSNSICNPQKCPCYRCDNILIHFTWNEDILLEVSRNKTKTISLTVQPCFGVAILNLEINKIKNFCSVLCALHGLQRTQPLVSRAAHSSCAHTSVPHKGWDLVQTDCSEEAFQGRETEPDECNLHPLIPTCTALPILAQASENRLICAKIVPKTVSV